MAVRKFKPTTPGQRHKIIGTYEEITARVPEKSLVFGKKSSGGRNNEGKMTMRYIGGGSKKIIRIVDFKRNKDGVPAVVKTTKQYESFGSYCFVVLCRWRKKIYYCSQRIASWYDFDVR